MSQLLIVSGFDCVSSVLFVETVFLADIMSSIRIISFWHTVCLLINVRLGLHPRKRMEKQPDKRNYRINNKEKIEELMNIYQEYIDKETSKEKKRNSIILTIFSVFAGVLTISFENMGVIGIDFTNWLYVATFLLVFVATAGIWIYSYTFFDTLKRKYELMIKDLKDLLLLKY